MNKMEFPVKIPQGYIMKRGKDFCIQGAGGKTIVVNKLSFPICIDTIGVHETLLEATYYVINNSFRTADLDNDCKNEIVSTIGE